MLSALRTVIGKRCTYNQKMWKITLSVEEFNYFLIDEFLDRQGKKLFFRIQEICRSKTKVNYTGYRYFILCSSKINISENFKHLSNAEMFDNIEGEKLLYRKIDGQVSNYTERR